LNKNFEIHIDLCDNYGCEVIHFFNCGDCGNFLKPENMQIKELFNHVIFKQIYTNKTKFKQIFEPINTLRTTFKRILRKLRKF
jgi:predicted metal-binding protein